MKASLVAFLRHSRVEAVRVRVRVTRAPVPLLNAS